MSKDWGTYRKLFEHLAPSFERLPFAARAMGAELIRRCDRNGRLVPGSELTDSVVEDLAFHVRAHTGEEDFLRRSLEVLLKDGYLVFSSDWLTIRNFVDAQRTASAERMALKRARDAAAGMYDEDPEEGDPDIPSDGGDARDASDAQSERPPSDGELRLSLVSSRLVSSSEEEDQADTKNSGSARARPAKPKPKPAKTAAQSEHVPVPIAEDWVPASGQLQALAQKYRVSEARLLAEVPEFRWYWREGKGAGKRTTQRGWAQTFASRIEILAKREVLHLDVQGRGGYPAAGANPGQDDAAARARRAAEVEARARGAGAPGSRVRPANGTPSPRVVAGGDPK